MLRYQARSWRHAMDISAIALADGARFVEVHRVWQCNGFDESYGWWQWCADAWWGERAEVRMREKGGAR